jgi:DNA invertase Pin-like site-specific DNA recombinase
MKIGYARFSSYGESLKIQEKKLKNAGCEIIFCDKQSQKSLNKKQELDIALFVAKKGDFFIVTELDRLASSVMELYQKLKKIYFNKAILKVLDQKSIIVNGTAGRIILKTVKIIANFEKKIKQEKYLIGISKDIVNKKTLLLIEKEKTEIIRLYNEEKTPISKLAIRYSCNIQAIQKILRDK